LALVGREYVKSGGKVELPGLVGSPAWFHVMLVITVDRELAEGWLDLGDHCSFLVQGGIGLVDHVSGGDQNVGVGPLDKLQRLLEPSVAGAAAKVHVGDLGDEQGPPACGQLGRIDADRFDADILGLKRCNYEGSRHYRDDQAKSEEGRQSQV
jgi:hypothetical protein